MKKGRFLNLAVNLSSLHRPVLLSAAGQVEKQKSRELKLKL